MFGLLFLLIAGVFADDPSITLDSTITGDCEEGEDGGAYSNGDGQWKCGTLAKAIAKGAELDPQITEFAIGADNAAFSGSAFTAEIKAEGYKINDDATNQGTLELNVTALTIGDATNKGGLELKNLAVTYTGTAAVFANVVNGTLTLTTVTFEAEETPKVLAAPLITVASGAELDMSGEGNKFTNINSAVDGGCVKATVAADKIFKFKPTVSGCVSAGKGAVAYIEVAGDPTADNFALSIAAGDDACSSEDFGDVIYLKVASTITSVTGHTDVKTIGAAQITKGQTAWNMYIMESGSVMPFFEVNTIEVSKDATDDENTCGATKCKTIANAIAATAFATTPAVKVTTALAEETVVAVAANALSVVGSSTPKVSVNNITLFTVSTGKLYLKTLNFDYAAAPASSRTNDVTNNGAQLLSVTGAGYVNMTSISITTALTDVLFTSSPIETASGSTLDMYGISATGLTLGAVPLFSLAGTYNFYKAGTTVNTFVGITRTGGANGGAIFELASATTLNLDNIAISNCTSVKAEGETDEPAADAIYMVPSAAPTFSFDSFTFTAPASSTAAAKFIFINATSADNLPTYQSLASFFWGSSTTGLIVRAKIGDETANVDMSTAGITIAMGTHASTDSADNCGAPYTEGTETKTVPCATLAEVTKSTFWTGKNYKALTIASGLAVQAAGLSIDGYLAISGAGPMTFKLASGALFTLSANAYEVDVNGCTFTYNDGTADTTNAEPVEISTPVFKLSGANNVLILTNVTIGVDETKNNLVLTTEAIIYSAGTVTIDGCTFEGINRKDDCLLNPSPVKDAFVMKNTNTFKTIAITGYGSGAAMATTLSDAAHAVVITGATFESCTSVGNAGALAFQITAGSLTVSKCTFTNCGATKSTKEGESFSGYGGALGIVIASGTPSFTFSELSFSGCTAATAGSVLAVMCPEDYMKTAYPSFAEFIKLGRTANVAVYGTIAEDGTLTPNDLYKLVPETVSVDKTNGDDTGNCGVADEEAKTKACATFFKALSTYYSLPTKIQLTKEAFSEETAKQWSLAQTMSIKGTAAEETKTDRTSLTLKNYLANMADTPYVFYIGNNLNTMTISITDITFNVVSNYDAETNLELFYVSTGATLELNNVGIANDTTSKKIQTVPIIDATNGKVSLTSVTFDKFYMKEVSLLNIPADHFSTFTLCTFTGITKESGHGSVLCLSIEDGMNFNLAENNFTSCKTLNGNGGAVYINYKLGNLTIGNQEFNQTKKNCTTLFKSCSAASATNPDNNDTNADVPTAGAGGAIFLNLESVDEEKYLLNITSILIEDCTAAKGGNAMYAHATTEEGTKLLENKNFWSVLTKINGNKKDEFTIMDNEGNEEKPKGSSSGFPIWAIIVIVVVVVVVIVIVVVIIVCCCCRSSS